MVNQGVQHIEGSVIARKPDAVFIEFGINDAFSEHETSVAVAKLDLVLWGTKLWGNTGNG